MFVVHLFSDSISFSIKFQDVWKMLWETLIKGGGLNKGLCGDFTVMWMTASNLSCALLLSFSPSFFLLSLSYSLIHLLFCHSFHLLVFSLACLFFSNNSEYLSFGTSKPKSLLFFLFVLLSVRKLWHRRVYYRREVFSDGIQTIGEEKHGVLLVTQGTTWMDNNKSSF